MRRRPDRGSRPPSGLTPGDGAIGAAVVVFAIVAATRRVRAVASHRHLGRYWPVAAAAICLIVALGVFAAHRWRRARRDGAPAQNRRARTGARRNQHGTGPAQHGWASRRDLAPLLVREVAGDRIVLGQVKRALVAAEHLQSVIVVGPSQSGKTTSLAVPAILDWDGPVLATSVKTDLVRDTVPSRSTRGELAVFDPAGTTGLEAVGWSPLSGASSWMGARRAADALCSLRRPEGGIEDAGYWYAAAERLLAPLLRAAALSGGSMGDVLRWLDEETVNEPLLALELSDEVDAARVARSCFALEDRQRSSVYSTAQTVLAAYGDPNVLSADMDHRRLEPGWLLAGPSRTLYCCAPTREQARLSPIFVALVREILDSAFDQAARLGAPLDPPLLVVLDEAANIAPLGDLDQVLATAAGHGISLVTVWQDLAQIEARYGQRWATIVNNHKAKVVFPGVADPRTLELVSSLIGDVETSQRSSTRTGDGTWSESESSARAAVAPAGWIRRIPPRHSLVIYGGLPPALVPCRQQVVPGTTRGQPSSRSATSARSRRSCSQ